MSMAEEQAGLRRELGIAAPDDFFEALVKAHEGLDPAQSRLLNARLIFLLANHVGDDAVLHEAVKAAREGIS